MSAAATRHACLAVGALALVALAGELAARAGWLGVDRARVAAWRTVLVDGEHPALEPRVFTSYAFQGGLPGVNDLGFADGEHAPLAAPGVLRVALVGGSGVQSTDPSEPGLARALAAALDTRGARAEVLSFAMPRWTTIEALNAWLLLARDFAPDVLVVHVAADDVDARLAPGYRDDYTHWRGSWRTRIAHPPVTWLARASDLFVWLYRARGGPVPRDALAPPPEPPRASSEPGSSATFARNVTALVEDAAANGARVVLLVPPPPADPARGRLAAEHEAILRALGPPVVALAGTATDAGAVADAVLDAER